MTQSVLQLQTLLEIQSDKRLKSEIDEAFSALERFYSWDAIKLPGVQIASNSPTDAKPATQAMFKDVVAIMKTALFEDSRTRYADSAVRDFVNSVDNLRGQLNELAEAVEQ